MVTMSYSRRSRYSESPFPYRQYGRSVSRSISRSRSRSRDSSVDNPGNNLYVTGLSTRITKRDLEKHFSTEGKVEDIHLVVDPRTKESRGFGFVTMSSLKEADRCIKYLDGSVLGGRAITIEKARRRRGRTPTPGRYLGLKTVRVRRRSPSYSPFYDRSHSLRYSSDGDRSRSYTPVYGRRRSYSPYYGHRGSRSPRYSRERSYSLSRSPYRSVVWHRGRSCSRSRSPLQSPAGRRDWSRSRHFSRSPVRRHDRSYSPYNARYSPYYRYSRRYRSMSRSFSSRMRRSFSRNVSPKPRSYSRSISPVYRRGSRRR